MKKFIINWNDMKTKLYNMLAPQPEIESEYIERVVHLLRRDFNTKTQNDILLAVTKKLNELREQDMIQMENDYKFLQENHLILKSKLAF